MKYYVRYFEKGNPTVTWKGNGTFNSKEEAIKVATACVDELWGVILVDFTIIQIEEQKDA